MAVTINQEKCCGDKICYHICPANCIEMNDNNKAVITRKGTFTCISCGHCIGVCPTNAISLEIDGVEEFGEPNINSQITFEELSLLMKGRRSVRSYKDKEISQEDLQKLFEVVRFAPTAKNGQYVKWIVINGKEKVRQLAGLVIDYMRTIPSAKRMVASFDEGNDPIFRHAPCVIFAYCEKEIGERFGIVDCSIASSYLELLLPIMGIGACWAGFAIQTAKIYEPINKFLGLSENDVINAGFMLGYSKIKYKKVPPRQKAVVTYL